MWLCLWVAIVSIRNAILCDCEYKRNHDAIRMLTRDDYRIDFISRKKRDNKIWINRMKWSLMIVADTEWVRWRWRWRKRRKQKKTRNYNSNKSSSFCAFARAQVHALREYKCVVCSNFSPKNGWQQWQNGKTDVASARHHWKFHKEKWKCVVFFRFIRSHVVDCSRQRWRWRQHRQKWPRHTKTKMRTESKPWRNDFCFVSNCFHFDAVLRNVTVRAMVQLVRFHHTRCN